MIKKAFIGYDLGDGETITDIAILDENQLRDSVQTVFMPMEMPDVNTAGRAIPTAFGYDEEGNLVFASSILNDPEVVKNITLNFKRCPSDLLKAVDGKRKAEILAMLEKGQPSQSECPELYSETMRKFSDAVITFTNAIFNDGKFSHVTGDTVKDCHDITFCVGHPTRWNDLDVLIYKSILASSVLGQGTYMGKPTELVMAAESRAAFLYSKDKADATVLPKGTSALLIDVGSSTIDLTAVAADSRNHQYNSGSNYLGVRSIDLLIREWYLARLKEDPDDWEVFQDLIYQNPTMDQALTLSCRMAKEEIYSVAAKKSKISFADFAPMRISQDDVNKLVAERPIGPILEQYIGIPADVIKTMGGKTWTQLFRDFMTNCKNELEAKKLKVGRILLTGSASKMPFVAEIVESVFSEIPKNSVLSDMNPSRSISMGLALVGPSNEKSKNFQADLAELVKIDVPECVKNNLPSLADDLSGIIENIINTIVCGKIKDWRNNKYKTLNDMTAAIEADCSSERLNTLLKNDKMYNDAINNWTINKVGNDIALRLQKICQKYNVSNLSLDQLNVMKVSSISIGDMPISPVDDIMSAVVAVLAVIAGVITAVVLPTVLGIVIGLIAFISIDVAAFILGILLAIPGPGWAILLTVVGIAVIKAAIKGLGGAKRELTAKLQGMDLPQWVRDRMTDEKIDQKLKEAKLKEKIKASILEPKSEEEITKSVSENLARQIAKRAEDIKYVIESK